MLSATTLFRWTQLDVSNLAQFCEQIIASEQQGIDHSVRTYPGYPRYALNKTRSRYWPSLDRVLKQRRSHRNFSQQLPSKSQ